MLLEGRGHSKYSDSSRDNIMGEMGQSHLTIKAESCASRDEERRLFLQCCNPARRRSDLGSYGGGWSASTCGIRNARLSSVATSRVVSLGVLFALRVVFLVILVLGGAWLAWLYMNSRSRRSRWPQPMLCLPDWSYAITVLYFLVSSFRLYSVNMRKQYADTIPMALLNSCLLLPLLFLFICCQ